jgi:hypothetical protein
MDNPMMRILTVIFICVAFSLPAMAQDDNLARQVLTEINRARTEPQAYAEFLRDLRKDYQGDVYKRPGTSTLIYTIEGVAAVDEAILFLSSQKPLPPLQWSPKLAVAAAELVQEQSRTGSFGHNAMGSMEMKARIERHEAGDVFIGESIAYGPNDPQFLVMRLLIDDGTRDRPHRKNQFDPDFENAGVSCGPHPRFGHECVIDFSGGLGDDNTLEKGPLRQKRIR